MPPECVKRAAEWLWNGSFSGYGRLVRLQESQQYFAGTEVKNDEKHYTGYAEKRKECGQMRLGVLANSYLDFSVMSRMNYL